MAAYLEAIRPANEMIENMATIIADIIEQFPEKEWLRRCREALPSVDDGAILSAIEIFSGGDVEELPAE